MFVSFACLFGLIQPAETPYLAAYRADDLTTNDVPQGRTAIIAALVKLPPATTVGLKLVAHTASSSASICAIYVSQSGDDVQCLGTTTLHNVTAQHAGTTLNSMVEIDLAAVSNTGELLHLVERFRQ